MSTGVTRVSSADLTYPSMSGSKVETTLGEMDALRASAANAIKVAQELEVQQGLIRIEVAEKYQTQEAGYSALSSGSSKFANSRPDPSWEKDEWAFKQNGLQPPSRGFSESAWVERKRVINITMANMEEVMGELAKEANFLVETAHKAEVTSLTDMNKQCQDKLEKANAKYYKAEERILELVEDNNRTQRESDGFSDTVDILMKKIEGYDKLRKEYSELSKKYADLTVKYNDIIVKKTFWGWLQEKLA